VENIGETRNVYTIFVMNTFGIRRSKAEDNINIDLRKMDCEDESKPR
jgi:hypothetical protein